MRTEEQITAELASARAAYHTAANTETAPQLASRSASIKALMLELDTLLCGDAKNCQACGAEPVGRLRTPAHTARGRKVAAVYCIQCVNPNHKAMMSVASTPGAAQMLWNAGHYE